MGVRRPEADRSRRAERRSGTAAAESEALRRRGAGPGPHTERLPWARPLRHWWGHRLLHAAVQPDWKPQVGPDSPCSGAAGEVSDSCV